MTRVIYASPVADGAGRARPKYQQIADDLRVRIETGQFPVASRLPGKTALMETYGVSLRTVDAALGVLRALGMAESRQGSGTYVLRAEPRPDDRAAILNRLEAVEGGLRQLSARVSSLEDPAPN